MYVIASDGGFLPEPVVVTELPILMGERFEILVDMSDGNSLDLVTLPVKQMGMTLAPFDQPLPVLRLQPSLSAGSKTLLDQLIALPVLPSLDGLKERWFQLMMNPQLDMLGMQALMTRYGHQAMAGMNMDQHGGMAMNESGKGRMAGMDHAAMGHGNMAGMEPGAKAADSFDFSHANMINGKAFSMTEAAFDVRQGQYEK